MNTPQIIAEPIIAEVDAMNAAGQSDSGITISQTPARDVIKSTLPPKDNQELAEELLARFPGVDRAELLTDMVASCFFDMRHGNKREERAACDFLNEVQRIAIRNSKDSKPTK